MWSASFSAGFACPPDPDSTLESISTPPVPDGCSDMAYRKEWLAAKNCQEETELSTDDEAEPSHSLPPLPPAKSHATYRAGPWVGSPFKSYPTAPQSADPGEDQVIYEGHQTTDEGLRSDEEVKDHGENNNFVGVWRQRGGQGYAWADSEDLRFIESMKTLTEIRKTGRWKLILFMGVLVLIATVLTASFLFTRSRPRSTYGGLVPTPAPAFAVVGQLQPAFDQMQARPAVSQPSHSGSPQLLSSPKVHSQTSTPSSTPSGNRLKNFRTPNPSSSPAGVTQPGSSAGMTTVRQANLTADLLKVIGQASNGLSPSLGTLQALQNPHSPQSSAFSWLVASMSANSSLRSQLNRSTAAISNTATDNAFDHQHYRSLNTLLQTNGLMAVQRFAMAVLYYSTYNRNNPWTQSTGWLSSSNVCSWFNRNQPNLSSPCDSSGRLISLDLTENNLIGLLPPEIALLSNLQHLMLGQNFLNGTLPSSLGLLNNLEELDLSNNQFSSDLPTFLGRLKNLQYLSIQNNIGIHGVIPVQLANLSQTLSYAYLQRTSLTGNATNLFCKEGTTAMKALEANCHEVTCDCCTSCCNLYTCTPH